MRQVDLAVTSQASQNFRMTTEKTENRAASPFPRGVQFTPVPNPLLANLLEEIDDINELKVTLRVIWALHRKRAPLPFITKTGAVRGPFGQCNAERIGR